MDINNKENSSNHVDPSENTAKGKKNTKKTNHPLTGPFFEDNTFKAKGTSSQESRGGAEAPPLVGEESGK